MDDLERVLWGWRRRWCKCRSVSNGIHDDECIQSAVSDGMLDDLWLYIEDWHDAEVGYEVAEAVKKATSVEEPAVPTPEPDDPE